MTICKKTFKLAIFYLHIPARVGSTPAPRPHTRTGNLERHGPRAVAALHPRGVGPAQAAAAAACASRSSSAAAASDSRPSAGVLRQGPYHSLIYGSFQEHATFVSHARTAGRAACHGDACLAKICGIIAADERHEAAYTIASARAFETGPDGMVAMPGELMTDGRDEHLFDHFSAVAPRAPCGDARPRPPWPATATPSMPRPRPTPSLATPPRPRLAAAIIVGMHGEREQQQ